MGKKRGWISAIKRALTPGGSKDNNPSSSNGKKGKSFIPRFREPSSIEKILGEADHHHHHLLQIRPQTPNPVPPPSSSWLQHFDRIPKESNFVNSSRLYRHASATKIQSAFRGYLARRNFRGLRGLVRLQGVVRSQNVKRQTMNAMRHMQLLVRVQTQIQSRRIQMLENQAFRRNHVELESNQVAEAEQNGDWDDSTLTKDQIEARLQKKVEAVIKRERAMAYAYSHRLWKANPMSTAQSPSDVRFPWWWNWLERHQLSTTETSSHQKTQSAAIKNVPVLTPPRPAVSNSKLSFFNNHQQSNSTKSHVKPNQLLTPKRTPPLLDNTPSPVPGRSKTKPGASGSGYEYDLPLRDDDSLMSCPPYSVPNYMNPTASAKAKAKMRASSNPKERLYTGTPGNDSKRRFSFSLTPNIASFKWNKGSSKDAASHKGLEKHRSSHSIGDLSIDSTISMPATVRRKPFNRFV